MRATGILVVTLLAACGGSDAFKLTSEDNNPERLEAAFQKMGPARTGPANATGRPIAVMVARGTPGKTIIAFDLDGKKEMWRAPSDIRSRVLIGRSFVAHLEGQNTLIGRDVATGKVMWKAAVSGRFVGATAEGDRLFYSTSGGSTWTLVAIDGRTGDELWHADSPGAIGTPAARGDLVFSPFLKQWLSVLDAGTGKPLARIRGIDEEITFVRATGDQVTFGSKNGVFLLDRRAASGKKAQSTYGSAALPKEFIRVHYDWDAFDPVQADYSAYDRNRVLWRAQASGKELGFAGDRVVVHTYRFFFGFDARSGALAWAYNHPRTDVVSSSHGGRVISFASMDGGIGALDPATGKRVYAARVEGQLLGATFDADGWAPADAAADDSQGAATSTVLASIANDKDARFEDVKRFAVTALAKSGGGQVIGDLIALVQSEKTPPALYESAVEALVERKDPASLPALVAGIDVRHDYLDNTRPRAVSALARAIASLGAQNLDPAQRGRAVDALIAHLQAPETATGDLEGVIAALGAIGAGAEVSPLRGFLLMYRADPAYSNQVGAIGAAIDVLLARGGLAERELVSYVAEDPRSQGSVRDYAARALLQTSTTSARAGGGS
jgi:outer membrane protein assembly factor BamB